MNYSKKRALILSQLMKHKDHPSAEIVFSELRKEFNISLSTVYRNLHQAAEDGSIASLPFAADPERFDPDTSEHFHFVCDRCHAISDIPAESLTLNDSDISGFVKGKISGHWLVFHGICEKCLKK